MKIICTVCSKEKNSEEGLLPAYLRYTSQRITDIKNIADKENVPFYLLSGKYGLIKDTHQVPYYDYLLTETAVEGLSRKVMKQILDFNITEIDFHTKPKETVNWKPYYEVIETSVSKTGIPLNIVLL